MNRNDLLKGLSNEQVKKIEACKNNEEILLIAKNEGVELTEEQLDAISGGACSNYTCPFCGSTNTEKTTLDRRICKRCGEYFVL